MKPPESITIPTPRGEQVYALIATEPCTMHRGVSPEFAGDVRRLSFIVESVAVDIMQLPG